MFKRSLALPQPGVETIFLWGSRQTGKSTLLREVYGQDRWVDLLEAEEFRRYLARPQLLRQELEADPASPGEQIVIDEIQKVPALLDEVHWLLENRGLHFALCGSSARKVKRGAANLLGGRAMRYEPYGLTAAEGLVRNLPAFSDFLDVAALSDGDLVNFSTVARGCGVSSHTAKSYFQILEDTLLGRWLPAYRKRPKRRVIGAPKFYFADVGVVNRLARRGELLPGSELYGKAFESWVFHELSAFASYRNFDGELSYWRLDYDRVRSHSSLGDLTPEEYAQQAA